MSIEDLPSLSETVKTHGLGANKKLGQHFLLDMNLTDKIVRLADPLAGHSVAEIAKNGSFFVKREYKAVRLIEAGNVKDQNGEEAEGVHLRITRKMDHSGV